jgi:hypothetical protein
MIPTLSLLALNHLQPEVGGELVRRVESKGLSTTQETNDAHPLNADLPGDGDMGHATLSNHSPQGLRH